MTQGDQRNVHLAALRDLQAELSPLLLSNKAEALVARCEFLKYVPRHQSRLQSDLFSRPRCPRILSLSTARNLGISISNLGYSNARIVV